MHGVFRNLLVRKPNVVRRTFEQRICKFPRRVRRLRALPELRLELLSILGTHLGLEQHLHRVLACLCSQSHVRPAALSFSAPRPHLGRVAASSKATPSQPPRVLPQSPCSRSSTPRGQSPAPAYPPSPRRKSLGLPCPSAPTAILAQSPSKHTRNAPSPRE